MPITILEARKDPDFLSLPPNEKEKVIDALLSKDDDFILLPEAEKQKARNRILLDATNQPVPKDFKGLSDYERKQFTSQRYVEKERRFLKNIAKSAPEDVLGSAGGIIGVNTPYPALSIPLAGIGGYLGGAGQEAYRQIRDPNVPFDLSNINYEALQAAKRQAAFEGVGKIMSGGANLTGAGIKRAANAPKNYITKFAQKRVIPEAAEMQNNLIDAAMDLYSKGTLTKKQAQGATLTLAQVTDWPALQFIEDASQNALGGGKIKKLRQNVHIPAFEQQTERMFKTLRGGGKALTPEQLGQKYGNVAINEYDAFHKAAAKAYEDKLKPLAREAFKGEKIVNVSKLNKAAFDEVQQSKYFADLGGSESGVKILEKVSKVPVIKETEEQSFVKTLLNNKVPEDVIKTIEGGKYAKTLEEIGNNNISFEDAIDLYHRINAAFDSAKAFATTGDEKKALLRSYEIVKMQLKNAMQEGAIKGKSKDVYDAFIDTTKWYSDTMKDRFNSGIAQRMRNEFTESPSQIMNLVEGKNAATSLAYAQKALGKQGDSLIQDVKNTWLEETFRTSKVFDPKKNKYITDPTKLQKSLDELSPEVKQILFKKPSEFELVRKTIRQGLIQDAPGSLGKIGTFAIGFRQAQAIGSLPAKISKVGFVLVGGPKMVSKISTDPKLVDLVLKIQRPTLEQMPYKKTYILQLYKSLISEPAIAAEMKLLNVNQRSDVYENDYSLNK